MCESLSLCPGPQCLICKTMVTGARPAGERESGTLLVASLPGWTPPRCYPLRGEIADRGGEQGGEETPLWAGRFVL